MTKKYTIIKIISFCFLLHSSNLLAQSISGRITDENNEPLIGVTVRVLEINKGAISDLEGNYELRNLRKGSYQLEYSMVGFETMKRRVQLGSSGLKLNIVLKEDTKALEEVTVFGKSEAEQQREKSFAVQVVEAKKFQNLSIDVSQILGKVSGINIRQNGGLGSSFSLSLNGLTGNQVKTFIDGIPMDYFGTSLSLNNFSANLIKGIEVYKGVVPIHLSSDALGGAINISTEKRPITFADVSYSFGSFNTHQVSANGQYHHKKSGFTTRVKSFYNYSDNNYENDVFLVNDETGQISKTATRFKRFHDAYNSRMIWLETGIMNKKIADELMIGALLSDNFKELQAPQFATRLNNTPIGDASRSEEKKLFNFSYSKKGLINKKLNARLYAVYIDGKNSLRDTSSLRYSWDKPPRVNKDTGKGEIDRLSLFENNIRNFLSNTNLEYAFTKNRSIAINVSTNNIRLVGSDKLQPQKNVEFRFPSTIGKLTTGLAFTNGFINNKLNSTVFLKYYNYTISSIFSNYSGTKEFPINVNKKNLGYGIASTYFLSPYWQVKLNFEFTQRFPEVYEILGDGQSILRNTNLTPERSFNYNLGLRRGMNLSKNHAFAGEIMFFVRDSRDFIQPVVKGIFVEYENKDKVLTLGSDISFSYRYKDRFTISCNITYQDIRDNSKFIQGSENVFYRDRIANRPFFFGNLVLGYQFSSLLSKSDKLSASFVSGYKHSFFLKPESSASEGKDKIPTQLVNNLQLVYGFNRKASISLSVNNVFNRKVYDNFRQERPGRSFNVKLRYFISK